MTDPAVQAVAEALWKDADYIDSSWSNGDDMPEDYQRYAQVAVDAHRRQVLASYPDAEIRRVAEAYRDRQRLAGDGVDFGRAAVAATDAQLGRLLAALADAEAARQVAEADRGEAYRLGAHDFKHGLYAGDPDNQEWPTVYDLAAEVMTPEPGGSMADVERWRVRMNRQVAEADRDRIAGRVPDDEEQQ